MQACMQAAGVHGQAEFLAATARRRRRAFASKADAAARLRQKPGFDRFTPAAFEGYIDHCLVATGGVLPPLARITKNTQIVSRHRRVHPP